MFSREKNLDFKQAIRDCTIVDNELLLHEFSNGNTLTAGTNCYGNYVVRLLEYSESDDIVYCFLLTSCDYQAYISGHCNLIETLNKSLLAYQLVYFTPGFNATTITVTATTVNNVVKSWHGSNDSVV